MPKYVFKSFSNNMVKSGKIYYFSTPIMVKYLLDVDKKLVLVNCKVNMLIRKLKRFIIIMKKYKSLEYLRARELGLIKNKNYIFNLKL